MYIGPIRPSVCISSVNAINTTAVIGSFADRWKWPTIIYQIFAPKLCILSVCLSVYLSVYIYIYICLCACVYV